MNVNEYIESGILDVYVLGGLSPMEKAEVEANASEYPEIKNEIENIKLSVESLLLSNTATPSVQIKENLFSKIDSVLQNKDTIKKSVPRVAASESKISYPYLAVAASWLITLFCGGLAYHYREQWQHSESKFLALQNQNKELADNFSVTKNNYKQITEQLSAITDTSFRIITLKAVPGRPDIYARVLWSKSNHQVFISASALPTAPKGKQYQLWAIVNGVPVDAGMISDSGNKTLSKMKKIESATAFAVTLEKEGGNPVPTMAEMYVMGVI